MGPGRLANGTVVLTPSFSYDLVSRITHDYVDSVKHYKLETTLLNAEDGAVFDFM